MVPIERRSIVRVLPAVAALYGVFSARNADAVTFTPVQPATCPARTEVNWQFNMTNSGTGEWMVPADDLNNWWNYANNVDYRMRIAANERVNEFYVRFDDFSTEPFDDYLYFSTYSPDGYGTNTYYSGSVPYWQGSPQWGGLTSAWPMPLAAATMRFHSDASDNYSGIALGRAAVCTRNPGAPILNYVTPGWPGERHSGVLLGTDDVVYFKFPVGSEKVGDTCTAAHDTFAMQGDPSSNNDFDLYVKCGALPTPNDFTARDFSGPSTPPYFTGYTVNTGFLHRTADACPCGSYWYVAVHSFNGSGWFNLYNHKHYASRHLNTMTTSIDADFSQGLIANMVQQLSAGFAHFFGANEGTVYFDQFTFKDEWDSDDADIQIHYDQGRPNATCSSSSICSATHCTVDLFYFDDGYGSYESNVLSHELGHYLNCFADEYDDDEGTRCGHSIMGTSWGTNNNFCYCTYHHQSACPIGSGDHGRNGSTYYNAEIWANWDDLAGRSPLTIAMTPDNYDFWAFDFHGQFAAPIVTNLGNQ